MSAVAHPETDLAGPAVRPAILDCINRARAIGAAEYHAVEMR